MQFTWALIIAVLGMIMLYYNAVINVEVPIKWFLDWIFCLNIDKYTYNNGSDKKSRTSFNGGLIYRTILYKEFEWQPELIFRAKGAISVSPANNVLSVAHYTNKLHLV